MENFTAFRMESQPFTKMAFFLPQTDVPASPILSGHHLLALIAFLVTYIIYNHHTTTQSHHSLQAQINRVSHSHLTTKGNHSSSIYNLGTQAEEIHLNFQQDIFENFKDMQSQINSISDEHLKTKNEIYTQIYMVNRQAEQAYNSDLDMRAEIHERLTEHRDKLNNLKQLTDLHSESLSVIQRQVVISGQKNMEFQNELQEILEGLINKTEKVGQKVDFQEILLEKLHDGMRKSGEENTEIQIKIHGMMEGINERIANICWNFTEEKKVHENKILELQEQVKTSRTSQNKFQETVQGILSELDTKIDNAKEGMEQAREIDNENTIAMVGIVRGLGEIVGSIQDKLEIFGFADRKENKGKRIEEGEGSESVNVRISREFREERQGLRDEGILYGPESLRRPESS